MSLNEVKRSFAELDADHAFEYGHGAAGISRYEFQIWERLVVGAEASGVCVSLSLSLCHGVCVCVYACVRV